MPRSRKTSSHPKRKIIKPIKIKKPVYPEYIENFIKEVESKTVCKVKVDIGTEDTSYNVGVLMPVGKRHRCIWMVNFATETIHLAQFWNSEAFRSIKKT